MNGDTCQMVRDVDAGASSDTFMGSLMNRRRLLKCGSLALAGTTSLGKALAAIGDHRVACEGLNAELRENERTFLGTWYANYWVSELNVALLRPRQIYWGNLDALGDVYIASDDIPRWECHGAAVVCPSWPWKDRDEFEQRLCYARVRLAEKEGQPVPELPILAEKASVRVCEMRFIVRLDHELFDRLGTDVGWHDDYSRYPASQRVKDLLGTHARCTIGFILAAYGDLTGLKGKQRGLMSQTYAPIDCPWANRSLCLQHVQDYARPEIFGRLSPNTQRNYGFLRRELGFHD